MNRQLRPYLGLLLLGLAGCATGASRSQVPALSLHLDYAGAEAVIRALEQDSLSDAEVDALLRIHGVRATMIDNVTRFIPEIRGIPEFRNEIRTFARTKRGGEHRDIFQLGDVWRERTRARDLINTLRRDESGIVHEALSRLEPYRPATGPLRIGVYFVAGGVSDGFALENDPRSFYVNLTRAGGDYHEVVANVLHEAYHVMQMVAQRRSGTFTAWITDEAMPPAERLLAGTLLEGTATFVADPARLTADAGSLQAVRDRYRRGAEPARISENFAVFDTTLGELRAGTMTWNQAAERGFSRSPENEERFYFVGYEMAKTIERYCGRQGIGRLFEEAPVEFFREYISLYQAHPEIRWRFSPDTEKYIASVR